MSIMVLINMATGRFATQVDWPRRGWKMLCDPLPLRQPRLKRMNERLHGFSQSRDYSCKQECQKLLSRALEKRISALLSITVSQLLG